MSHLTKRIAAAALLGAALVAHPLMASAANTSDATTTSHHAAAKDMQAETVEQRISSLYKTLKITPDEDAKWADVATAMRENAAVMEKLTAEKVVQNPTAVQDLKNYEQVTQAHVDGLKNLIASFSTLYDAMPDGQKKVADQAFQSFGHKPVHVSQR